MSEIEFKGAITALVTPFKSGKIDFDSFKSLLDFQLQNGINTFVVNGTTAESPALEWSEVEELFKFTRKHAPDSRIILGTGSNATQKTIECTAQACELGADAALVVCPYYNKPPQAGVYQHFLHVAESTELPVILYNVPGRTVTNIDHQTVLSLSELKNIVGIKEASGNVAEDRELIQQLPKEFLKFSGDDATCVDFCLNGGQGVISVMSNMLPGQTIEWMSKAGVQNAQSKSDYSKYEKLVDLLFLEPNPIPVKKALQFMGIIESAEVRLPLVEMTEENAEKLNKEMKNLKLI